MFTKEERAALDRSLLEGWDSAPGRVRTSLINPERQIPPHSCALTKYDNHLHRLLTLCSRDLRYGCGEKVILDSFHNRTPCKFKWGFNLDVGHPDFIQLTERQRSRMNKLDPWDGEWIFVADSMERHDELEPGLTSIEESWGKFIELAEAGKTIWVDLSRLRPYGTTNDKGLMASGPIGMGVRDESEAKSFFSIYEALANHLEQGDISTLLILLGTVNDTLRRGGHKRGIITSSMIWSNPHFQEYLAVLTSIIPGSHKKGVRLTSEMFVDEELVERVAEAADNEGVFLIKVPPKEAGHSVAVIKNDTGLNFLTDAVPGDPEVFPDGIALSEALDNVCVGLRIRHRGTCLIWRINYGQIERFEDIPKAYCSGIRQLVYQHTTWRDRVGKKAHIYLPVEEDRQVGLCVMGFANALAQWGIKYKELNAAIARFLDNNPGHEKADELVFWIAKAHQEACWVADEMMGDLGLPLLERIFTVEPGQNHPYYCVDLSGNTCSRGIWPPFHNRPERRNSQHQENIVVRFGKKIEVARDLGAKFHQEFDENWQLLMNFCSGNRAHTISHDTYVRITPDWLKDFMFRSPLQTKYYSEHGTYHQDRYLTKRAVVAVCGMREDECSVCAE